jgi:PmbA protein
MNSRKLLSDLLGAARRAGADQADALMVSGASVSVSKRLGRTEEIERAETNELGLRVFVGQRSAIVSSGASDPSSFARIAEQAVAMARVVPEDRFSSIPEAPPPADAGPLDLDDPEEPGVETLLTRAAAAEDAAMAVKGITNSEGAGASWSWHEVALATSRGFIGGYARSSHSFSVAVIAGEGTGMQRDYDFSSAVHGADLDDPAETGRRAAERALRRLDPRRPKTARLPVVYDPRLSGGMVGHFIGAINGASVARGTSFLKDRMDQRVFGEGIAIIDDPLRVMARERQWRGLPWSRTASCAPGFSTAAAPSSSALPAPAMPRAAPAGRRARRRATSISNPEG